MTLIIKKDLYRDLPCLNCKNIGDPVSCILMLLVYYRIDIIHVQSEPKNIKFRPVLLTRESPLVFVKALLKISKTTSKNK